MLSDKPCVNSCQHHCWIFSL